MKAEFLALYWPHFEKIQNVYSNIDIVEIASGEYVRNRFKQDQVELRFRARDGSSRTDVFVQGSLTSSRINTASHQFAVRTVPDKPGAFTLQTLEFGQFEYWQPRIRNCSMYLPFVPYCWLNKTLLEQLSDETTTVRAVTHSGQGPDRICTVETSYSFEEKHIPLRLEFLEGKSWVLSRGTWISGYTMEVEYDGTFDGIPLAQRCTIWMPGQSSPESPRYQGVRRSFGGPPETDSVFGLAEFGLPSLRESDTESPTFSIERPTRVFASLHASETQHFTVRIRNLGNNPMRVVGAEFS